MSYSIKSFDDILQSMIQYVIANTDKITDMTPGSVIRSFCEATGLVAEEIMVSAFMGFKRNLQRIGEITFNFARKEGTKASASVVFGRTGTTGTVTVPAGTRVKTSSGLRFVTQAIATITAGQTTSNPVEALSDGVGVQYNVSATAINVIEDVVAGVETVTNALAATGGVNAESDLAFNKRFQLYIEGLAGSNIAGLKAAALGVEGITSASIVEHFPPVSNKNVTLYIDDATVDGVSTAKVTEVQGVIDGTGTTEDPGYRSAGVNVVVTKPTVVSQDVTMDLTVLPGVDGVQTIQKVKDAITEYVNTLGVAEDIIYNEIISAAMDIYGVTDCDLTEPTGNVTIADSQVGRLDVLTVTA